MSAVAMAEGGALVGQLREMGIDIDNIPDLINRLSPGDPHSPYRKYDEAIALLADYLDKPFIYPLRSSIVRALTHKKAYAPCFGKLMSELRRSPESRDVEFRNGLAVYYDSVPAEFESGVVDSIHEADGEQFWCVVGAAVGYLLKKTDLGDVAALLSDPTVPVEARFAIALEMKTKLKRWKQVDSPEFLLVERTIVDYQAQFS
jgi:hypothetical protein